MRPLLPTYLHLLVSAIFPIYTAAHASLTRPTSAAPRKDNKGSDSDDELSPQRLENLSPSDAIVFPLLAGGTLALLYVLLKWLQDPAWLNWALGIYFSQIGLFFSVKYFKDILSVGRSFLLPTQYSSKGEVWKSDLGDRSFKTESGSQTSSPLPGLFRHLPLSRLATRWIWTARSVLYTKATFNIHVHRLMTIKSPIDVLDVTSFLLSCGIISHHTFISKPWFVTNFIGFSFCYGSLQYMTPTTAWTGTLILGALFFYDIYFVFFTPMMVTVATKLDVPIKLLFPRPTGCVRPAGALEGSAAMEEYLRCLAKKRTMAMLGLGDIVVPGMMIAFALRFDLYMHYLKQGARSRQGLASGEEKERPQYLPATGNWGERFWTNSKLRSAEVRAKDFPKPYFHATLVGYLVGMVTTVVVMQVAEHAQPALLYLVPGVLMALWGTALLRGDVKLLWLYTEAGENEKENKPDNDKDGETEKGGLPEQPKSRVQSSPENDNSQGVAKVTKDRDETQQPQTETVKPEPGKDTEDTERLCRRLFYLSITLPDHKPHPTKSETENRGQDDGGGVAIPGLEADQVVLANQHQGVQQQRSGSHPPGKEEKKGLMQ